MKKTLVLGATPNPDRYAYRATQQLTAKGHEVVAVGKKTGEVEGITIQQGMPEVTDVDTITLYLNPTNQEEYYDYILDLKPQRIIFNPGTENPILSQRAKEQGIETEIGCTLVMLSVGTY